MKLLLFDVDLTLISTDGAGVRALDRAFEQVLGRRRFMDGVRPHGKTDPAIIREACLRGEIPASQLERHSRAVLERYLDYLGEEVARSSRYRVMPGIVEILTRTADREDVVVGLATGNVEAGARIKLERGGLNRWFPFGGFGSDSEIRTELVRQAARRAEEAAGAPIDPADTFVIGDTPLDVEAGREAGFRTIAVATGHYSIDDLAATRADLALPDLERGQDQFWRSTRIL